MKAYAPYLSGLSKLLHSQGVVADFELKVEAAVNGQASLKLEALVHRTRLKQTGAFFSSPALSQAVARDFKPSTFATGLAAADPACGAGNLLIAAANKLPAHRSLNATLTNWGRRLAGFDLHPEFVDATHLRLALLGLHVGARFDLPPRKRLSGYFPHIRAVDGIRGLKTIAGVGHLLLNPPYNQVTAPANCRWGQGKISKAALFVLRCIEQAKPGTRLSAILPDVLRSGSRYRLWREEIERLTSVKRIASMGNFQTADVDVFVLDVTVCGESCGRARGVRWWSKDEAARTIGEQFHVHVGSVVKHRVKKHHPKRPYLHAKGLPFWGELTATKENVRFAGSLVTPPFVVIRRTSSPTDRHRALATLVTGRRSIAVDNHLVVCTPRRGGIQKCRALIDILKSSATDKRLNRRIRCRHLTVGVVRDLPFST